MTTKKVTKNKVNLKTDAPHHSVAENVKPPSKADRAADYEQTHDVNVSEMTTEDLTANHHDAHTCGCGHDQAYHKGTTGRCASCACKRYARQETEPPTAEVEPADPAKEEAPGQVDKMMQIAVAANHHAPKPKMDKVEPPPVTELTRTLARAGFQFVTTEVDQTGTAAHGYAHLDGRAALYFEKRDDVNAPEMVAVRTLENQTINVTGNVDDPAKTLWGVIKPVSKRQARIRRAKAEGARVAVELRTRPQTELAETPMQALETVKLATRRAMKGVEVMAAQPVNGVPQHVVRAVEMLGEITGKRFDPTTLTGDKNYSHRMALMRVLLGRPVGGVRAAETGVYNLVGAFYTAVGAHGKTVTQRAMDFTARCLELCQAAKDARRAMAKAKRKIVRTARRARGTRLVVPGQILTVSKPLGRRRQAEQDAEDRQAVRDEAVSVGPTTQPRPAVKGLVFTDVNGLALLDGEKNGITSLKLERCNSQGALQVWDNGTRLVTSVLTPVLAKDVKARRQDLAEIEMFVDTLLTTKSQCSTEIKENLLTAKTALQHHGKPFILHPLVLPMITAPRAAADQPRIKPSNVALLEDPTTGPVMIQLERGNSQGAMVIYNDGSRMTVGVCPPEWLTKFRSASVNGHAPTSDDIARAINQLLNPDTPGVAATPTAARHLTAVLESIEEKTMEKTATRTATVAAGRKFTAPTAATKSTKPAGKKSTKPAATERKSSLFRLAAATKATWSGFTTQKGEIVKALVKLNAVGSKAVGATRAQLVAALPRVPDKNISFYLSKWQKKPVIIEKLAPAK